MRESTRRKALTVCLALGMADLFAMNIVLFPDVVRRRHAAVAEMNRTALARNEPVGKPPVKVDVEVAPPLAPPPEAPAPREPASQPMESSVLVFFPTNSHQLGRDARALVDRLAPELAGAEGRVVVIDGHADARGSERHNDRLSRRRAEAVASRLKARGIGPELMVVRSFGSSRPVATGDDPRTLQRNRRVEIQLRREPPP